MLLYIDLILLIFLQTIFPVITIAKITYLKLFAQNYLAMSTPQEEVTNHVPLNIDVCKYFKPHIYI